MGCQQQIAEKIVDRKADYVLAVKENQGHLLDDIKEAFEQTPAAGSHTSLEKSHGRIEKRTCKIIADMDWICKRSNWKNLQSIVRVESERTILATGEQQSEVRYYIASMLNSPKSFLKITRQHWSLDVTFKEDLSTKQAGNAAENFSTITKVALNLLKNNKSRKLSLKRKRLLCSWDNDFLGQTVFKEN
jgi:predicted transposase YbfD/YdcC